MILGGKPTRKGKGKKKKQKEKDGDGGLERWEGERA